MTCGNDSLTATISVRSWFLHFGWNFLFRFVSFLIIILLHTHTHTHSTCSECEQRTKDFNSKRQTGRNRNEEQTICGILFLFIFFFRVTPLRPIDNNRQKCDLMYLVAAFESINKSVCTKFCSRTGKSINTYHVSCVHTL